MSRSRIMRPPTAKLTFEKILLRPERAGDVEEIAFRRPSELSRLGGRRSAPAGADQRRPVDPEVGKLLHRELDEDLLVLGAEDLDLRDIRHVQESRADVLNVVAKLAIAEAIRGEAVNDAERIAELVVEPRSDDASRQVWRISATILRT